MSDILSRRLALLGADPTLLAECLHGIERETLRVDARGQLSCRPHPRALGSALTHPQITTDYSEALLEFITPTGTRTPEVLDALDRVHRAAVAELDGERLWSGSMPCALPAEDEIPIADYGSSNIGRLKHVYRRGLALRYSRTMQCIAGIHYNFSLPEAAWELLRQQEGDARDARDYQSARYIALIRNFRRYSWLLMYLFGASPALDAGFLRGRPHRLQTLDERTLYLPHATSLRMSDLGYQSNAQASLTPDYNDLTTYTESLRRAVGTPYPPYAEIGTHQNGEWVQLNTNILQIENEYYATIRPKRVTRSGERPVQALMARGVQYIEVRCLDIDPFLPLGIDTTAALFLDAFLLYCALEGSPPLNGECSECTDNFASVVREGRKPGLRLQRHGASVTMIDWAAEMLDQIERCAETLDASLGGDAHRRAVAVQRQKVADVRLTPSARVLQELRERGESFADFGLRQSEAHAAYFASHPLSAGEQACYAQMARQSLEEQAEIEAAPQGDFDTFVAAYQASILATIGV
ncbi:MULTISPECIES: glutamate--cysteine ligase [Pseudomonas]|uniref:glutamate--cysteine ligase n=1 Tax=Pseudomonadaceae TaxID=135621 RepID=UPI0003FABDE8|nr:MULTISPECIES: glutamate--cysteine ligase [Pseudomonas]